MERNHSLNFKVIIVGGPCGKFINKCIDSILEQGGVDLQVLVSLDNYDDAQQRVAEYNDDRIKMAFNTGKEGGLYNICRAVSLSVMDDSDILCFIDGDDWLTGNDSLATVKDEYDRCPETLVTHGGWTSGDSFFNRNATCLAPYYGGDFKDIRKATWKATALKTMRYRVFKNIDQNDFKHDDGSWITTACDHALMMPAVEMAGYNRTKWIEKKIYFYNRGRVVTSGWISSGVKVALYIRAKKPYKLLED
jgi:glycosyltransferase involved in cell wall biosynthesis